MLKVEKIVISGVEENTYVIYNEDKEAVIVDPGGEPERIIQWVKQNGWELQAMLITHSHPDHVGAVDEIRAEFNIEAYVHEIETEMFIQPLSLFAPQSDFRNRPAEHYWSELGTHTVGSFTFDIAHVPGHSPGHVIYIFHDDEFVISGDTVFAGSIGRTDFPGGGYEMLMHHIGQEIITLPKHYTLYPGHGEQTTIDQEIQTNPFFEMFRQNN